MGSLQDIDIDSGKILNWRKPTKAQLKALNTKDMKVKTFNTMNLIVIGTVNFMWNKSFRQKVDEQRVYIGDVHIMCETDREISKATEKALLKLMKKANSSLLTDGRDFFTTRGNVITQIKHGSFNGILNMHKEEVHELLYE